MAFREGKVIRRFRLRGKEVVFRYPRKGDLANMVRHINSLVEERAYIAIQTKQTGAQQRKWLNDSLAGGTKGSRILVCVLVGGKYAGSSGITRNKGDARRHVVTLGITLGKDFRNMGIGTELLRTMESLARREMKARVIQLSYFQDNERSKHVYEKLGYREIGRVPKGVNHYGKYGDEVLMVKVLK